MKYEFFIFFRREKECKGCLASVNSRSLESNNNQESTARRKANPNHFDDKSKLEFLQHNWDKVHLNAHSNKHH